MSEDKKENDISEEASLEETPNGTDMEVPKTKEEIIQLLKTDVEKFNAIREANPSWTIDISEARLCRARLSFANLAHANLEKADLLGAKLGSAELSFANLVYANLEKTDLLGAKLFSTNLTGATLIEANLAYANLEHASLEKAILKGANLERTSLVNTNLRDADLRGALFDAETNLERAKVKGAKIYKFELEQLKDYGGMTLKKLREMEIVYDLGTLRRTFGGWMSLVHIVALVLFVSPYIFYLGSQIVISRVIDSSMTQSIDVKSKMENELTVGKEKLNDILEKELDKVPLVTEQKEKVLEIVKKEINDQNKNAVNNLSIKKPKETTIWWTLLSYIVNNDFKIFCFLLVYNLLRILLLWKTKSLEHIEAIQGLCSDFTFAENQKWEIFYKAMEVGFYMNIALVVYHSYHFFSKRIYFY